jgi:hypothetical protein
MSGGNAAFHVDEVLAETDAAIKVEIEGEEVWVPKSQIHDDSEVYSRASGEGGGMLVVTGWWARKAGLAE